MIPGSIQKLRHRGLVQPAFLRSQWVAVAGMVVVRSVLPLVHLVLLPFPLGATVAMVVPVVL
ncbi:hypothetical protein DOQ87_26920 [Salmonella enterica subsp. enterica serovar Benin]|nr:hypothetical protein [Salmonella enterica subsp. enterica serovar Benin]EBW4219730.1 hypothetical protein [Salmonella enterica subsp. enterica serovar Benin]ECE9228803.1 hypothetical protein [Salmonella enterica subsp. enterica serovar Benin]